MSETPGSRRILRSIGAELVGLIVIFVLHLGTDVVMHAVGIFPPWFQPMAGPLWVFRLFIAAFMPCLVATLLPGWRQIDR